MVLECAEALLALPNALGVVVPRVRHSPLAFPIAAPWKLVSLARAIAMVELLAQLDHAEGERPLAHIRIHSLEDVIVRPIPLEVHVPDCARDVSVASLFGELVGDVAAIPAVHLRDVEDLLKALLVKC